MSAVSSVAAMGASAARLGTAAALHRKNSEGGMQPALSAFAITFEGRIN
jgi:hypothetical protein